MTATKMYANQIASCLIAPELEKKTEPNKNKNKIKKKKKKTQTQTKNKKSNKQNWDHVFRNSTIGLITNICFIFNDGSINDMLWVLPLFCDWY